MARLQKLLFGKKEDILGVRHVFFYSANFISKYLTNHHFALKQFYFLHVCLISSSGRKTSLMDAFQQPSVAKCVKV